jgi:leucyl aminopeptidase
VAAEIAEREGLALTVLDEAAAAAEHLGGLLGVAAGSTQPPRLIELVYEPPEARATVALVGKGITFDSGGLSIKTAEGMETMKTDMSGAAAVLAAMSTLPAFAPGVKVIAIVPATENMPGGSATKPGDVLHIRNGKTVEVLNTDAEGRLVLADGLSLAVEAGVDAILDLATLTGACIVALGRRIAGLMGNNEAWIAQVRSAADRAGEAVWPLPLPEEYRKNLDSEVADIKNIGGGRFGGALTAGLFLKEFVGDVPWAHLDIAGPARSEEDDAYLPKGGTGFGVRTIVEALRSFENPAG